MMNVNSDLNKPSTILLELHYLPCIDYFAALQSAPHVILDVHEHFQKQSYRNRCYVSGANKMETLIVPLVEGGRRKALKEVKIDYSESWVRVHWGCLRSAYGKSPYFEYYAPYFESVYQKKPTFLIDLNYELLTICLKRLRIQPNLTYSLSYSEALTGEFDARNTINNKKQRENYLYTTEKPYYQTFGKGFLANLSIVDLLFNTGPEAGQFIFPDQTTISV